jgi:hypothetical protein
MPWFSDALVAPFELQRRVADLPLSIELGSAEMVTVGRAGAAGCTGGGGGGGGGGTSFSHPAANSARLMLSVASAIFRLLIMELIGLLTFLSAILEPICWTKG